MFSEINVSVEDGNLGRSTSSGTGIQVKIGASSVTSSVPILITGSMRPEDITAKLGHSPLADACMDATENGLNTIYAFPVRPDIAGTVGSVKHTGTGEGIFLIDGTPNNAYDIVVEIVETGNVNAGTFRYSMDGGNNFGDEITIPITGAYELAGTGLTLKFTDASDAAESFLAGDAYAVETTAPSMNNQSVLKTVEKLRNFSTEVEIVHIVGTSGKSLWAALQAEAVELLEVYKKPVIFLCEGRACAAGETLDEYLAAMKEERRSINSIYVSVVLSYGVYARRDYRTQIINLAGVVSGLLGRAKESLSVGYVKEFAISSAKLMKLLPEGVDEYTKILDETGYTMLRQYTGLEDYYVSNANVLAAQGSDFPYVENVRVLCRIIRAVARQAVHNIQTEIDPNEVEASIKSMEAELNIPMDRCLADKIISSGSVEIDTDVNILVDETLSVRAEWVPMGSVRKFDLAFAVNNPYASK